MPARTRTQPGVRHQRPWSLTGLLFVLLLLLTACGPRFDRESVTIAGGTTGVPVQAADGGATGGQVDGGVGTGVGTTDGTGTVGETTTDGGTTTTGTTGSGTTSGSSTGSGSTGSTGSTGSSGGTTGSSGGTTGSTGSTGSSGGTTSPPPSDPGPNPGVTDDEILIGYLLPLTGAAPLPAGFDQGVNTYWNFLNENGGINGRSVRINIYDTESNTQNAVAQARRAVQEDKVFTLLSLDRLEIQDAIAKFLEQVGMPHIMVQAPVDPPAWKNTFVASVDHGVQGRGIATFFAEDLEAANGAKKVAVVREQTPALKPGVDAFEQRAAQLGLDVVAVLTTDPNNNDQSGTVNALRNSGAEIVWLYMAPTVAANIISSSGAQLYTPVWFANNISWQFELMHQVTAGFLNGSYAFSSWVPLNDPRADQYKQEFRRQNGNSSNPDDLGLVGWGAGEVVSAMLAKAGPDLGWNTFRNAVQNFNAAGNVWTGLNFTNGFIGANVVKVYKSNGNAWSLVQDDRVLQ